MIVLQTPLMPGEVLKAISAIPANTTEYRIASAYVTYDGARLLVKELSAIVSSWAKIPKALVTCFDFGITDPGALEYLQVEGFEVRIANLGFGQSVRLWAHNSSYHPKLYAAIEGVNLHLVAGSANLTRRAFTVNTEAVMMQQSTLVDFAAHWEHLVANSVPLTGTLLDEYKGKRPTRRAAPIEDEPRVPAQLPVPAALPTFRDEVDAGRLNPEDYQVFWVQVGGSSGGSGNQLELPRRANRFFGYHFDKYYLTYVDEIGELHLRNGVHVWDDRKLTWHGDNRMERLNLPTKTMSGLTYNGRVVMFHRSGSVFDLTVADQASVPADAWRAESAANDLIFRFGPNSNRLCGLF